MTSHEAQLIQDVHFLATQVKLSGEYVKSMTWRMRKEMIEYHKQVLEYSKTMK